MKYILILGDGMADCPVDILKGKTPLEVASKPFIDGLQKSSEIGLVKTIPDGMKPGSDIANLSVLGYDPVRYYTGRSPLEALNMGIDLQPGDIAVRANLVTLDGGGDYDSLIMADYSAGEISTAEAKILVKYIYKKLGTDKISFYNGVSYRHCMVVTNSELGSDLTPPHDISGRKIGGYLPKGVNGKLFDEIMRNSYELLNNHPVNVRRRAEGKKPANSLWLWGEGVRPTLVPFQSIYGKRGAVISAVDLLKGIAKAAGMGVYEVKGATGTINTNFAGKANAALKALIHDGYDFVYLHIEAPDECSHQKDLDGKIKSIELIDSKIVKRIANGMKKAGLEYSMLLLPDHPTPLKTGTHSSEPVPYMLFRSADNSYHDRAYCEKSAEKSGVRINSGMELMNRFMSR
jgi:2,3-bisphosphoglycerate-independent phosphoglycerate mutase